MRRRFVIGAVFILFSLYAAFGGVTSVRALSQPALVKTDASPAVYYVYNNQRYAFPNEKTFFTWYPDFSSVVTISASELASYPLVKNVTYRPNDRLLKIATDPKVYAVTRCGTLHWISTEALALQLWGSQWNRLIDDLPDSFFSSYTVGNAYSKITDYLVDPTVKTIADNVTCSSVSSGGSTTATPGTTTTTQGTTQQGGSTTGTTSGSTTTTTQGTTQQGGSTTGTTQGGTQSGSQPATGAFGHTYVNSIKVGNCPLFSDQYLYYQRVDDSAKFPVLSNSATMVKNMGLVGYDPVLSSQTTMLRYVDDSQPLASLGCTPGVSWCPQSLIGTGVQVPYPSDLQISTNTDAHTYIIHETSLPPVGGIKSPITTPALAPGEKNCYLYETYRTAKTANGFTASALSVFDLKRDLNYVGNQVAASAASSLPVSAGIIGYDEAIGDRINHAIGFAIPLTRFGYISPAANAQLPVHCTSASPASLKSFPCDLFNVNLPAMGQRFRLKASYDETPYKNYPITLAMIHAMKKYGLILTDGSGQFTWKVDLDPRFQQHLWPDMQSLKQGSTKIPVDQFEAIQSGTVIDATWTQPGLQNQPNSAIYN